MQYTEKALQIIEVSKKLFAEKGIKEVTTKEIAEKAGVNEVTIFRQFGSKDNLLIKIIEYYTSRPDLEKLLNQEEPELRKYLKSVANLIYDVFRNNFEVFKIELFRREGGDSRNLVKVLPNAIRKKFSAYLVQHHEKTLQEADIYAVAFMSSIHGLCMNHYMFHTFDPKPNFENALKLTIEHFS